VPLAEANAFICKTIHHVGNAWPRCADTQNENATTVLLLTEVTQLFILLCCIIVLLRCFDFVHQLTLVVFLVLNQQYVTVLGAAFYVLMFL